MATDTEIDTDSGRKAALPRIIERIIDSYEECGRIHHLGLYPLPSYAEVVAILKDLREIIYPGYGRRQNLHMGNVAYHVGDVIDSIHDRLSTQLERAYKHDCHGQNESGDFKAKAQQITVAFLEKLPELRDLLVQDAQACYDGDPAAKGLVEVVFCYPGLAAITVFRIAHELFTLGAPLIPRMMTEYAHSKTGIDIHPGAHIGPRIFIDHGTGVVIGETTDIGQNVKIYQGVTLGALSFPKDDQGQLLRDRKRHPTLEDDVVIYANATILGGKTVIGRGSIIGSSAWITRSVDPFTTVTIESPRLRERKPGENGTPVDYQI